MLTDLIATIKTLRGRIRDYRPYFDAGRPEARTRVSLIDPLLRALEWDVGNPGLVEIEPVVAQGRADYAFMRGVGEPLLLLEAKRLSDRQAHHGQLATYVVGENLKRTVKIPYCAVTNGSRWQVFDVFTQECVLDASVEDEDARRCALKLVGLWQPVLRDIGLVAAVDLSAPVDEDQADARDTRIVGGVPRSNSGPVGPTPSEHEGGSWMPLDSEALSPSKHVRPAQLRLPDGSVVKAESWARVLVATARWLFDGGLLDPQDMPFSVVGVKCCVSTDGRRPDGRPFRKALLVGETGIQLEGDLTGRQIVRFGAALLQRSGKAPSQVELKLAN